jgi:HEAT repeat protein
MTSRAQFISVIALSVAVSAVSLWSLLQREPSHDGRSLSQWLEDFDFGAAHRCAEAAEAMDEIGTNAIPRLLSLMNARDTPLDRAMEEITESHPSVVLDWDTAFDAHWRALRGFEALGARAATAIPALEGRLNDGDNPQFIAFALAHIGIESLPALQRAATNHNHRVRSSAVAALGALGPEARPALGALVASLSDANASVRRCAAVALGQISDGQLNVLSSLGQARHDLDAGVRDAAAAALDALTTH